jgi:hypothetical protein
LDPGFFFSFVIVFTQMVELLGLLIRPSQGLYLYTGEHRHGTKAHTDTVPAFEGVKTVHASDLAATVIGIRFIHNNKGKRVMLDFLL